MSSVKRFRFGYRTEKDTREAARVSSTVQVVAAIEDDTGRFVHFTDYEALRAQLAALQAQVAEAERQEPVRFVRDNVGGAIRGYDLRTGESCGLIPVPCAERSPVADRAAVPDGDVYCPNCYCSCCMNRTREESRDAAAQEGK